jgi:hypothetical protein
MREKSYLGTYPGFLRSVFHFFWFTILANTMLNRLGAKTRGYVIRAGEQMVESVE